MRRFAVVTGATGGIGLALAHALAGHGFTVMLVGRDAARLEAARERVAPRGREAGAGAPLVARADLATLAGMRNLVEALARHGTPIDALVNNAGAIYPERALTADGIERTFALNHIAPFVVTNGVLPLLRAAAQGRVVTVSSEAHRWAPRPYVDWQSAERYSANGAYGRSKLANILFTRALATRERASGVTANCFHPGVVRTGFGDGTSGWLKLMFALGRPFLRTPERGAATGVHLATAPALATVSGLYFADERPKRPSAAARDDTLAESLWSYSTTLAAG